MAPRLPSLPSGRSRRNPKRQARTLGRTTLIPLLTQSLSLSRVMSPAKTRKNLRISPATYLPRRISQAQPPRTNRRVVPPHPRLRMTKRSPRRPRSMSLRLPRRPLRRLSQGRQELRGVFLSPRQALKPLGGRGRCPARIPIRTSFPKRLMYPRTTWPLPCSAWGFFLWVLQRQDAITTWCDQDKDTFDLGFISF